MVPSTLKCSVDRRRTTFGWASTAARNLCATSPASSRSRFLPKLVWSQTASSTRAQRPTEQEVVVQPLHNLTLGADAVEGLQQQRPQQTLRRDRGPADTGRVDRLEIRA